MERWVAEIRLRARRPVGELSAALDTAQGVRSELLPTSGKKSDALAAAGLSTSEAHRCEQIAKVPEATFEAYIAGQSAAGKGAGSTVWEPPAWRLLAAARKVHHAVRF